VISKNLTSTIPAATAGQIWNCSACGTINITAKYIAFKTLAI